MPKIDSRTYKKAMYGIGEKYGWKCVNCGKPIPQVMDCIAHVATKNGMSREDRLTKALPVCRELHAYEHQKARNLSENTCVSIYLSKYGNRKDFFQPLWEEVNKC